jgi:hypothetical protein
VTVVWDLLLQQQIGKARQKWERRHRPGSGQVRSVEESAPDPIELPGRKINDPAEEALQRRHVTQPGQSNQHKPQNEGNQITAYRDIDRTETKSYAIPITIGLCVKEAFDLFDRGFACLRDILILQNIQGQPMLCRLIAQFQGRLFQPLWTRVYQYIVDLGAVLAGPNNPFGQSAKLFARSPVPLVDAAENCFHVFLTCSKPI